MDRETHWAEQLESGDRVLATIRHKTDGSLNRHNVKVIVDSVDLKNRKVTAFDGNDIVTIPFNELRQCDHIYIESSRNCVKCGTPSEPKVITRVGGKNLTV